MSAAPNAREYRSVNALDIVSERAMTPKTMPTPSTMPIAVSSVRCALARRLRSPMPEKRRSLMPLGSSAKGMLVVVGAVREDLCRPEAVGGEAAPRELQARQHKPEPGGPAGEVRSEAQANVYRAAVGVVPARHPGLGTEAAKSHELAPLVEGREVRSLPAPWVQELLEVVGVARRVVEIVGQIVAPRGDLAGAPVVHR